MLIHIGCAASPPAQSDAEPQATSDGSSCTAALEQTSSSSPSPSGPPESVWDPQNDAHFIAAGSHAANAGWLSTGFVVVDRTGARLFDEEDESVDAFVSDRPVYAGTFDGDRVCSATPLASWCWTPTSSSKAPAT